MSMAPDSSVSPLAKLEIVRPIANFQPSIWGDLFLNYDTTDLKNEALWQQQVEKLKVVVKREVFTNVEGADLCHLLKLIDAIQCLGIAYHFEQEIEDVLQHIHATYRDQVHYHDDLYTVALCFRLLRQHGYHISSDIFNKFKDANGGFKQGLVDDGSAMLSLYEAAHLRVRGEDTLEEALDFTTTHLEFAKSNGCYGVQLSEQIAHQALARPLRKTLDRISAKRHMSIYENEASFIKQNEDILNLAKLDFNLVQLLHKKELCEITRWWKEAFTFYKYELNDYNLC